MPVNMVFHKRRYPLCLREIAVPAALFVIAVLHIDKFDAGIRLTLIAAREGHQFIPVNLLIGEGNQLFVPAPVMPEKSSARQDAGCLFQNGFINLLLEIIVIVLVKVIIGIAGAGREETGRRQLSGIAGNDDLIGSENGSDGILRKNLRCLIKDDQVKMVILRIQKVRHGERRHHEAGFQRKEQPRNLMEQLSKRHNPAFLLHLVLQRPEL